MSEVTISAVSGAAGGDDMFITFTHEDGRKLVLVGTSSTRISLPTNTGALDAPISIAEGGTGQVTKAAAFNALSPMSTAGDMIYGGTAGAGTRLAGGTSGQILVGGGTPSWGTLPTAAVNSVNLDAVARLGIGTTDTGNVLSVSGASALFANGAGDIRVSLSKYTGTNTASFVFQDNFSGRAEFGLTGSDDFTMKVSADGSAWVSGIVINRTTGAATFLNTIMAPVATLPGTPITGMEACVNTATIPAIGSALSLGGGAFAKAIYNGSHWTVIGV